MIEKAMRRAYDIARARKWNKVYWAIDLHETCLRSNYGRGSYTWLGEHVVNGLRAITARPESVIILWSSVFGDEEPDIIKFFADSDIEVNYFNHNPEVINTAHGNFDTKFFFSVLLDDKAGFDHLRDWDAIIEFLETEAPL